MKLASYKLRCAIEAADYALVGQIMADHFGVPAIAELSREISPAISAMPASSPTKYIVVLVYENISYRADDVRGFYDPAPGGALFTRYRAFGIYVRK